MHNCYSIPVELKLQDIRRQIDADQGVKSTSFHISHSPRSCGFRHIPIGTSLWPVVGKYPAFALRQNMSDVCDRDTYSLYVSRVLIAKAMDRRRRKQ